MLAALILVFVTVTKTASQSCQYNNSVELTDRSYKGVKFMEGEYYVDNITQLERGCICMKERCIRMCCPPGQAFKLASDINDCAPYPQKLNLDVYKSLNSNPVQGFNPAEKFHILYGKMECNESIGEGRVTGDRIRLLTVRILSFIFNSVNKHVSNKTGYY